VSNYFADWRLSEVLLLLGFFVGVIAFSTFVAWLLS